ncbi:hypothetical protein [Microbacterium hydrothermale]|uniref:hypothetical protein n=1 Tax=Microbacterium hydrothermale TaxID=857427 RepID=UPI0010A7AD79|nr:hypothetical protein [Microbacterium hydrothermale]
MNDELTPEERAALRARIMGGARDIMPVGGHRAAWIAGSIAAVLVVGIAGGVAVTSTLGAPQVATSPSPTAAVIEPEPTTTPTPTPTPTPSATSTAPTPDAFGGDCANVLSDEEASAIVGVEMVLANGLAPDDPGVLGGISCQWRASGEGYEAVGVSVFPSDVVPETLRGSLGVPSNCSLDALGCRSDARFGDAVVSAWGSTDAQVAALLAEVGPRAEERPGVGSAVPPGAWAVPDCETVLRLAQDARGEGDLTPHRGDYFPFGLAWDVMSANGAAGYCALDNGSSVDSAAVIDILFGPGSEPDAAAIEKMSGVAVSVEGADAAWHFPEFTPAFELLLVQSGRNMLSIGTGNLTEAEMARIAEGLIGGLE